MVSIWAKEKDRSPLTPISTSLSLPLKGLPWKCKAGQDGMHPCKCGWPCCLISIRQDLISWVWEDFTYENEATSKIQTTAFGGFLVTSWVWTLAEVPQNLMQCGQDLAWPQYCPPSSEPQAPVLLEEKCQERFFISRSLANVCSDLFWGH